MQNDPLHKLTATPTGITLSGAPLTKQLLISLPAQSVRYIERAQELLKEVRASDWECRITHANDNFPPLAKVNMLLALAAPQRMDKYSPDQPRDYHGRWTEGGRNDDGGSEAYNTVTIAGNSEPMAYATSQIMTDTNNNNGDILGYPNGKPVIDPNTGTPYPVPSGMNIANNATLASSASLEDMYNWFQHGGAMDYQRASGSFNLDYRNVSNYNFGVVAATRGYSLTETLVAAGLYNVTRGSGISSDETIYGIKQDAVNNITQGWKDSLKWSDQ